jgi:hypothetical protein
MRLQIPWTPVFTGETNGVGFFHSFGRMKGDFKIEEARNG